MLKMMTLGAFSWHSLAFPGARAQPATRQPYHEPSCFSRAWRRQERDCWAHFNKIANERGLPHRAVARGTARMPRFLPASDRAWSDRDWSCPFSGP